MRLSNKVFLQRIIANDAGARFEGVCPRELAARPTNTPARTGDLDAAYAFLARCLDHYAKGGTVGSAWGFLWLPEMKPFRLGARFQDFIARMQLLAYWLEYGAPDGCELREGALICG